MYDGTSNSFNNRTSTLLEGGKSFSVLDIGLSLNYKGGNSLIIMPKLTLDASQYQYLSNEYSVGIGYFINSPTPLIFDISSTIMAQVHKNVGIGATAGYMDFSGKDISYSKTISVSL
jgi:hypothetical protein